MQETIWNRYGGYSFVAQTVRDFYDRLLVSKALAPHFDGVNMEGLIEHQIQTVGAVMGGPYDLNVEALRRAHRHLRVQQTHFDELAVILDQTLDSHGLSANDKAVLLDAVESVRSVIVDPTAGATRT
ncbi:MAG: group 1 truncated hemoglobin [Alphaproteobacteria bacterium]|nr:group 1 truncated hemoglobin [Alphaproteobacteria bacterium]